jgi:hypothetical protein
MLKIDNSANLQINIIQSNKKIPNTIEFGISKYEIY